MTDRVWGLVFYFVAFLSISLAQAAVFLVSWPFPRPLRP